MESVIRVDYLYGFIAFRVCPDYHSSNKLTPRTVVSCVLVHVKLLFFCGHKFNCDHVQVPSYQGVLNSEVSWPQT